MNDRQTLSWLYSRSKLQLIPMLALIVSNILLALGNVIFALACRGVIDAAVAGAKHNMFTQGVGLLAVIVMQLVLRNICGRLVVSIQGRLEMNFRAITLGQILRKDYSHTASYHSGELMNRLTSDVTVVGEGITTILPGLADMLTRVVSAFCVLFIIAPTFAIIFVVGGVTLFFTVKYFREKLKYLHKDMQEKDGRVRSFMQEILENLIVVKVFAVEATVQGKSAQHQQEHYQARVRKNSISVLANSGFSFIFSMGYLYALVWSSLGLLNQTLTFGTLTAILQLVGQVQTPFIGLSGLLPKMYSVLGSAERMIELENLPDERETNAPDIDVQGIYGDMHSIEFKDVSFQYDRDIILNHAELNIEKGDLAIVLGPSGIGKSTLLKLFLGVLAPTGGAISINLNNGEKVMADKHTRRLFAYVPQGNLLFSGTIRENICFVIPKATDEEIMAAAQISCAAEFIAHLPQGLNTVIGEKGHGLSEGQVQRLAIARAVLSGAPILLLDEATSALDEATEKMLLNNIRQMTGSTCIIVSHKQAALSVCNREIYIENGEVKTIKRGCNIGYRTA